MRPCQGDYQPPEALPDFVECRYEKAPPSMSNQVNIGGGATCAEARQLIRLGPSFGAFKRHPVVAVSDERGITGDWICEAERSGFRARTVDIVCESGDRRVAYRLP